MKLVALGNLDCRSERLENARRKRLAGITAVGQNIYDLRQMFLAKPKGFQRAVSVRNLRRCDVKGVRQPVRVHAYVPLDARDFLAGVIALVFCCVRIFDTLGVNDKKSCLRIPPKAASNGSDHIFLTPLPRGSGRYHVSRSTSANNRNTFAISENQTAASATGSRFSKRTERHRKPHRDQRSAVSFSFEPFAELAKLFLQKCPVQYRSDSFFSWCPP